MIEWFDGSRSALADLFALADDAPEQVQRYRELGRVLVAKEGPDVIGHLQLISGERPDDAEVKSLAVDPDHQRSGIGRSLMRRAIAICREEHRTALLVATATADTGVLRFYQRLGFRFQRVERDVFTSAAGYPPVEIDGVALRDQIWLSLTLKDSRARPAIRQVRIARHTDRLDELVRFYRDGIGLAEVGGFRNHDGYDGVFLALPGTGAHLELTAGGSHRAPEPHPESLLVLYLGDEQAVHAVAARLRSAPVVPANPYWAQHATTFADPDGFHVVLVPDRWEPAQAPSRIRDATMTEREALEALQRRSSDVWEQYRAALAAHPDAIELPQAFIERGWVRVAIDDVGAPVGFSVVIPDRGEAHELDGLFVEPAHMKRGVGRALVADAAERALGQGAEHLDVTAGPAEGFYEKVGFHRVGDAQTRFGPAVRMRRELRSPSPVG
jgi:GNAT superfamily N-acetyltransferase